MKWIKIDQRTGEVAKRGRGSFSPHDYISGSFRIINKSWEERKLGYILTCNGNEVAKFDTLKQAKARAEAIEPLAEYI